MILRRLYLYIVSAASLAVLVAGLALLGATIFVFVYNDPTLEESRGQLAVFAAMTLVAAPVWGLHYWFGRRFARRDPAERASAIRRLYVYFACLGLSLAGTVLIAITFDSALTGLDGGTVSKLGVSQTAWAALVVLGFWGLHARIAGTDRRLAVEQGGSATLRRWYTYIALLVGLLVLLSGVSGVLTTSWLRVIGKIGADSGAGFAGPLGLLVAGFALWGYHARQLGREPLRSEDQRSTLRAVEGFLVVLIAIATALVAASEILHYALARMLGVENPLGAPTDVVLALAGPAPMLVVYGVTWQLVSRRLRSDAAGTEGARQAGVRRLYTNLVNLASLGTLGVGAGGLLWVLSEQVESPLIGVGSPEWRDPLSLWVTLLVVGTAVWVFHWRPAPAGPERQALSRRLYLYAALLASVLVVLGSAVGLVNAVLRQVVSSSPHLDDPANLDFGHFLAVLLVASAVGLYHWQALRADAAARPQTPAAEAPAPRLAVRYEIEVVGADAEDIRRALARLPAGASFRLQGPPGAPAH